MPIDFNQQVIDEFRANQGRVGGPFENARLLLLTTTGAKSGEPHTTPVGFLLDDSGRLLLIASAGGAPNNPDWYHNLLANPLVDIEIGVFTGRADAAVLDGDERDRIFVRAVEADQGWAAYQAKTNRIIPVVALTLVDGGPKATSWSESLKQIHDGFRHELALVRKEIAEAGPRLGAQLRINCLNVCGGLHHHHVSEDGQMFPAIEEQHPELAPAVARLRAEHQTVQRLVDELQELISSDEADPAVLLTGVDRLIADLEAHLDYEETQLLPILDTLEPQSADTVPIVTNPTRK